MLLWSLFDGTRLKVVTPDFWMASEVRGFGLRPDVVVSTIDDNADLTVWDVSRAGAAQLILERRPCYGVEAIAADFFCHQFIPAVCVAAEAGVVVFSGSDAVRVCTMDDDLEVLDLLPHSDGASCVASTPDAAIIVTGAFDGFVRVWTRRVAGSDTASRTTAAATASAAATTAAAPPQWVPTAKFEHWVHHRVRQVQLSSDGALIMSVSIKIYDEDVPDAPPPRSRVCVYAEWHATVAAQTVRGAGLLHEPQRPHSGGTGHKAWRDCRRANRQLDRQSRRCEQVRRRVDGQRETGGEEEERAQKTQTEVVTAADDRCTYRYCIRDPVGKIFRIIYRRFCESCRTGSRNADRARGAGCTALHGYPARV